MTRAPISPQSALGKEAVARLRAYWCAESNGEAAHGHSEPLWGVCPCCRTENLGIGTWPDGGLRTSCWECGALEEDIMRALGLPAPVDPWSREGMLARLERVIAKLEWQTRTRPVRQRLLKRL